MSGAEVKRHQGRSHRPKFVWRRVSLHALLVEGAEDKCARAR